MYFVNFNNRPKSLIKSYFYDPSNASRDQKIRRQFEYESVHSNCRKKYYWMKFDFVLFLSSDF